MLAGHLDQGLLCGTDGRVGGLARHGGLREELGPEVLHRDGVVIADHPLGPLTGRVLPLSGHLAVEFRCLLLRLAVTPRGGPSLGRTAPGHHPLVTGQLLRRCTPVLRVGKVVGVTGGGGGLLDAPVDPDHTPGRGQCLGHGRNDKRRPPMPHRIPVHTHARRGLGQLTRPHRPHHNPAGQMQTTILQPEPTLRVFEGRQRLTLLPVLRHPGPLPHRHTCPDVLQRLGAGPAEVTDHLLLRHTRTLPQPPRAGTGLGQHRRQLHRTTHVTLSPLARLCAWTALDLATHSFHTHRNRSHSPSRAARAADDKRRR